MADKVNRENELDAIRWKNWNTDPIEQRIEAYGSFLRKEDFDNWQQFAYKENGSIEKKEGIVLALREKARSIWIMSRFVDYYSDEWRHMQTEFSVTISKMTWYEADLKKKGIKVAYGD